MEEDVSCDLIYGRYIWISRSKLSFVLIIIMEKEVTDLVSHWHLKREINSRNVARTNQKEGEKYSVKSDVIGQICPLTKRVRSLIKVLYNDWKANPKSIR